MLTPAADPLQLARQRFANRGGHWQKAAKTKVFTILSVGNWETILLPYLDQMGEHYHFQWPNVADFFENKADWQVFHEDLNKRLLNEFNQFYEEGANITVFIYASDFSIAAATLKAMQKKNVLIISFCWDDLLYFKGKVKGQPVGVSQISKIADCNLTFSPEAIPQYHYHQSACFFWESALVNISHDTLVSLPETDDRQPFYVLFIGTKYGWRGPFIEKLQRKGIPVLCYGKGWKNGTLSEIEMKAAIQKAPLTLGFSNAAYTWSVTTIKGRDFEIPSLGGLYITQYAAGIEKYYQPGKEIFTYHRFNDCYKTIKEIAQNPAMANRVRLAGYRKSAEVASWDHRFAFLTKLISEITA